MAAVHEEEYDGPALSEHDKMYIIVGGILAVLTAIEVALYYVLDIEDSFQRKFNVWALLALAFAKFIIVASVFMHLKFDTTTFRRLFAGGAALASFCYVAVLYAFGVFRGVIPWLTFGGMLVILAILATRPPTPQHGGHDAHDSHGSHDSHDAPGVHAAH
jgi:heme/copper-type cytochrome/quinol oxidase subunit 4